jgi:hypothetical protein
MTNGDFLIYVIAGTIIFKCTSLIFDIAINGILAAIGVLMVALRFPIYLVFRGLKVAKEDACNRFSKKDCA